MHAHIQAYLRTAASRVRVTEQVGPFLATISPDNTNPYLNYAIPDDGATPTAADVAALIAAFQARQRTPRLEYLTSLAPAVEAALVAGGFVVEGRLPLMVYDRAAVQQVPDPDGIELLAPRSADDLLAMITAQNEAYGEGPPDPSAAAERRSFLAAGGCAILARDALTGEPAGGGVCDVPTNSTTELTSIGVRPAYRRRGIAGAMTARLVNEAHASGTTTVFLMAESAATARIYARVGFVTTSDILHISLPAV